MSVESALVTILESTVAITSLVDTRIYPMVVPQGESMPALTYQRISGPREHHFDGADGQSWGRFQINCWAGTYDAAIALKEVVRLVLDGFEGVVDSVRIQWVSLEDEGDLFDLEPQNTQQRRYGKRLDFIVHYEETANISYVSGSAAGVSTTTGAVTVT